MMKKILISMGILLVVFAVVGLFTKGPLVLAFFGTIAGLFALMAFWAVKYYVEARRMGVKPPKGARPIEDETNWRNTDEFTMPGGLSHDDDR